MRHAPSFWASKLPETLRLRFWALVSIFEGGYAEPHLAMLPEDAFYLLSK